jgi:hypothetical protein
MNSPATQNFSLSFTGIAVLGDFKGLANGDWHHEVLQINIEDMRMDKIMERVNSLLPPVSPDSDGYKFVPLQWTIHASFPSIFNAGAATNAGWEIDNWKIIRGDMTAVGAGPNTVKVLEGLQLDISVRDKDGEMKKVGYTMELYGYFVQVRKPKID